MDALELVEEWRAGGGTASGKLRVRERQERRVARVKTEEEIVAQNNRALAYVSSMMPGGLRVG